MSLELATIKTCRVAVEPAGSYGVDIALGASFQNLPVTEDFAMPAPEREMLDPMVAQALLDSASIKVAGKRSGSMKVDLVLGSHGLDTDGTVAAPSKATWPLRAMLETVLGGYSSPTALGSLVTVQAASTTTLVNVTAGDGALLTRGQAIGVLCNGVMEVKEILSIATNAVSLREACSATPTGTIRHAATFFATQNPSDSLQFELLGAELDDHFRFSGAQIKGFSIEAKPGMLPKISFDLAGRGVVSIAAHSGLAEATFANYSPIVASGGCITVATFGSTTRVDPLVSDFSCSFDIGYEPVTSYCATDNIVRMRRKRAAGGRLAKGTFTIPYEDTTWITARDNRTIRAINFQIGSAVGATMLLSFPRVQIVGVKRASSGTNLAGQTIEWEALQDTLDATTDLGRASARLHFI